VRKRTTERGAWSERGKKMDGVRNQRGNPQRGYGVEESQPTERLISPAQCGVPNARRTIDFPRVLAT